MDMHPANNENLLLCARCGGACCRTLPGIDHPGRVLAAPDPPAALASLLAQGEWVLCPHPWRDQRSDIWQTLYYPRPATTAEYAANTLLASQSHGVCIFLAEDGCRLSFDQRPFLCQTLEPDVTHDCSSPWGKRDAAIAWLPHQEIVHAAVTLLGHDPLPTET